MSETVSPAAGGATPAPSPSSVGAQAIHEAVALLRAALPKLRETNPSFADGLSTFLQRADDPVRLNQAEFQHQIAYAVKDVERLIGPLAFADQSHRMHLNDLSISAPGLKNERAQALLADANSSSDGALRSDIRRAAREVGKQADQDTPQIRSQLDTLDNRVRLSTSVAPIQVPSARPADGAAFASPGLDAVGRPVNPGSATSSQAQANLNSAQTTRQAGAVPPNETLAPAGASAVIASSLLRGFTKLGEAIPPPPWEAMTTNFGDRLKAFEERKQANKDQKLIEGVEQSGRNALSALQSFASNEGATMMNRINQAARSDPNGIEGVMAEMREGGRYAGLRQQFNAAITEEKGFGAAYDKALEAVGQYAQDRAGAKPIIVRSADAVAVTARLEAVEQNIGERLAGIPSRTDGKAMMDDLRQQAAEIFKAVAEGLKNMFQRVASGASASPSP